MRRTAAVALVLGVVAVSAVVLMSARSDYRVVAVAQDAGQLVRGNLVKVGGVEAGIVEEIELDSRNRARVVMRIEDERFHPLHRGTTATIRSTSLSAVAGRVVSLHPGRNDAAEIPDGGEIPTEDTQAVVELDQVLNALDAETRSALQDVVTGLSSGLHGRAPQVRAALEALSPGLRETGLTAAELVRDQAGFERALVTGAGVASAVADERAALESGIAHGATAVGALAREADALDDSLSRAPSVLREATATLGDLRTTIGALRPTLRLARPATDRLAPILRRVLPVTRAARPALPAVRGLLRDATPVLRRLPSTDRAARPAVASLTQTLTDADPIVQGARVYVPDVVAGIMNGFGGTTGIYYDANGHYVRISIQGNPLSVQGGGSVLDVPAMKGDLYGFRRGVFARCPGAATQQHPDRSNPWHPPEAPCRSEDDTP